jgi:outer membrane protein OmpA-like peptidoglycan-associated protein
MRRSFRPVPAMVAMQLGLAGFGLAACSSAPPQAFDDARLAVEQALADPELQRYASGEVERARLDMVQAERAYQEGALDADELASRAYVIQQYLMAARATAQERQALEQAQVLAEQRDRVRLEGQRQQTALAEQRATAAERELQELRARETSRGAVITLGDVLFDTASATLNPGGMQQIARLATFLAENPDRTVLIEGHTDSRGSESYNLELSQRRADSVRNALIGAGVDPARINARGLGEAMPVASNETAAGRQQNRRVEVVVQSPGRPTA